jgi:hypothetical protein
MGMGVEARGVVVSDLVPATTRVRHLLWVSLKVRSFVAIPDVGSSGVICPLYPNDNLTGFSFDVDGSTFASTSGSKSIFLASQTEQV